MPESDYCFEDVFDNNLDLYFECFNKTRRKFAGVLTDQIPLQSATASVWIQTTKEKSTVAELTNRLKTKVAKLNVEAIPSATKVWEWHFSDLITECGPRMKGYIAHCVNQNMTPEEVESHVKEYLFHLRCEKLDSVEEQHALGRDMFGEDYDV